MSLLFQITEPSAKLLPFHHSTKKNFNNPHFASPKKSVAFSNKKYTDSLFVEKMAIVKKLKLRNAKFTGNDLVVTKKYSIFVT